MAYDANGNWIPDTPDPKSTIQPVPGVGGQPQKQPNPWDTGLTSAYQQYLGRPGSPDEYATMYGNPGGFQGAVDTIKGSPEAYAYANRSKTDATSGGSTGIMPSYVQSGDPTHTAVWNAFKTKGITPRDQGDFQYWVDKMKADPVNQQYWLNRMDQASGGVGDYGQTDRRRTPGPDTGSRVTAPGAGSPGAYVPGMGVPGQGTIFPGGDAVPSGQPTDLYNALLNLPGPPTPPPTTSAVSAPAGTVPPPTTLAPPAALAPATALPSPTALSPTGPGARPALTAPNVTATTISGGKPLTGQAGSLYDLLLKRANQSLVVDPNDPVIKAQVDPYRAEQTRASRDTMRQLAEKATPYANLSAETRAAGERVGQMTGAFEGQLMGSELAARRGEIESALSGARGLLTAEQSMMLQEELANIHNAEQQYEFGTSEAERQREYDASFGEGQREFESRLGEEQRQFGATFGEGQRQFGSRLGEEQRQFGATFGEGQRRYGGDLAERQREFGTTTDVGQRQFADTLANQQYQQAQDRATQQRQFGLKGAQDLTQTQQRARLEEELAQLALAQGAYQFDVNDQYRNSPMSQ